MSIARIIWAVSLLAAIVLAFVNTGYDGAIIAILGLISGWFVQTEHRLGLLIAAAFLYVGGAASLGGIPSIGTHLTAILGSITALMGAAGVLCIVRRICERVLLNKGTAG